MVEEANTKDHAIADIDDAWMNSMAKRLQVVSQQTRREPPTIHRVPQTIRQSDNSAYEPKVVSIGPYHRGKESLEAMEEHKWHYLHTFLSRDPNKYLGEYLKEIQALEEQARFCYSEKINLESHQFVEMMLLDGCFTVELFLNLKRKDALKRDPVYCSNWMLPLIAQDMLLLENQLPFFILQRLFDLVHASNPSLLVELALTFFENLLPRNEEIPLVPSTSVHHLLHLFHSHLLPVAPSEKLLSVSRIDLRPTFSDRSLVALEYKPPSPPKSIPSVREIRGAGIKFKKRKACSFLGMKLNNKVIEIPTLSIYESTNSLFRNLIAFEQCCPKFGTHFTSYAVFMYCILEMPKDVTLLKQNRIIKQWLGSDEEVVNLFNRMCKGIAFDFESNHLSGVFRDVARICESDWHSWRATLMRDYFSSPWSILQVEATVLALVFTLVQTFLAVLAYYRPREK